MARPALAWWRAMSSSCSPKTRSSLAASAAVLNGRFVGGLLEVARLAAGPEGAEAEEGQQQERGVKTGEEDDGGEELDGDANHAGGGVAHAGKRAALLAQEVHLFEVGGQLAVGEAGDAGGEGHKAPVHGAAGLLGDGEEEVEVVEGVHETDTGPDCEQSGGGEAGAEVAGEDGVDEQLGAVRGDRAAERHDGAAEQEEGGLTRGGAEGVLHEDSEAAQPVSEHARARRRRRCRARRRRFRRSGMPGGRTWWRTGRRRRSIRRGCPLP